MPKQRGLLVVFSGLDGAGKSTQINLLMEHLRQQGFKTKYVWARGGYTPWLEQLKRIARRMVGRKLPPVGHSQQRTQTFRKSGVRRFWLSLAMLDLIWVWGVQLRWWKRRGQAIICDRYLWDTLIDFRLNFPQEQIERWWLWRNLARVTPTHDAYFWMWITVEESVRRSEIKGAPYPDSPEVLRHRLSEYQALAVQHAWHSLDGRRSIEDVADEIRHVIEPLVQANQQTYREARPNNLPG